MKHYLIRYLMFSLFCFAQEVTFTEKFDDGGLKSITYFKKIGNKFILDKEEKFYEDGSLWYSCELKELLIKKNGNTFRLNMEILSFHSNGGEKEKRYLQ